MEDGLAGPGPVRLFFDNTFSSCVFRIDDKGCGGGDDGAFRTVGPEFFAREDVDDDRECKLMVEALIPVFATFLKKFEEFELPLFDFDDMRRIRVR